MHTRVSACQREHRSDSRMPFRLSGAGFQAFWAGEWLWERIVVCANRKRPRSNPNSVNQANRTHCARAQQSSRGTVLTVLLQPFAAVSGLRHRYAWAMNALPMLFMVAGVAAGPLGVGYALDIPLNAPMLSNPWGWWITIPMLIAICFGIALGWLLGVVLNMSVAALLTDWRWSECVSVFWFKQVPDTWRLPEWRGPNSFGLREAQRQWDEQRAKGVVRGILRYAVPLALPMFFSGIILPQMENPAPLRWQGAVYPMLVWVFFGTVFGWLMWKFDRRPE
jgi:MFS family permease